MRKILGIVCGILMFLCANFIAWMIFSRNFDLEDFNDEEERTDKRTIRS